MDLAGDLDVASILSMHRALMTGQQRAPARRWREEQVWIGGTVCIPVTPSSCLRWPRRSRS